MNTVLPDGTSLSGPADKFDGLCKAYWGRKGQDYRLVFLVSDPAYVLTYQHGEYAGVMPYETMRLPEGLFGKASMAVVYSLPALSQQKTKSVQQWLSEAQDDLQKFQRLLRVTEFVEKLENSGTEPIFFPFLCGRNLTVHGNAEIHLLGAPIDVKGMGDAYIQGEVQRFIDPNYLAYRNVDNRSQVRPADQDSRRRYLRYGLTHMILEAAYGKAVEDHGDISSEELPAAWLNFESIFDAHLNNRNSPIEVDTKFYSLIKKALSDAVRPTPPEQAVPQTSEPVPTQKPSTVAPLATPADNDDDGYLQSSYDSDLDDENDDVGARRGWLGWVAISLLVILGGLIAGFIYWTGFNVNDPLELKRLRAESIENRAEIKRLLVESLINRWIQEPEKRSELASTIFEHSPNNLNLRYLQLLDQIGDPQTKSLDGLNSLLADFEKTPEADRFSLIFSRSDLATIQAGLGSTVPPQSDRTDN